MYPRILFSRLSAGPTPVLPTASAFAGTSVSGPHFRSGATGNAHFLSAYTPGQIRRLPSTGLSADLFGGRRTERYPGRRGSAGTAAAQWRSGRRWTCACRYSHRPGRRCGLPKNGPASILSPAGYGAFSEATCLA